MRFFLPLTARLVFVAALSAAVHGQDTQSKEAPVHEMKGIPPRATPADYQAHTTAGAVTIAAEFTGHSVPTPEAIFTTEDYVAVEVALFSPPQTRLNLSFENFSLRVNGKKVPLPAQAYTFVFKSLKDPEWEPPEAAKAKTSINTGGGQNDSNSLPTKVHMPIGLERAMEQKVQGAALPEAEHTLPTAGLLFFQFHGKTSGIYSLDLIYAGPAGKATLSLHP